jgi:hypothetical protein
MYSLLPELPREFAQIQKSADEMSFSDLNNWVRQMQKEGYDPVRYRVIWRSRFPIRSSASS